MAGPYGLCHHRLLCWCICFPHLAVTQSCVVFAFGWLALQSFSVPALSSGPGCDYRSHENCGLSVSVGQAEYCLNRNSCAALYPDVANRVCECVFEVDEGVCVGCWTGWAMWLSCHGPPWQLKLIIIFLSWSIVKMQSMFFFFIYQQNNEYAKKKKKSGVKLCISWSGNSQTLGLVTRWWLITLRAHLQYSPS